MSEMTKAGVVGFGLGFVACLVVFWALNKYADDRYRWW